MVNSRIDRKDLDSEMTVVRNEMERGENNPSRIAVPAGRSPPRTAGTTTASPPSAPAPTSRGVDIDRLRAFYRTYYQPDNAVLVVAGEFDPDRRSAGSPSPSAPSPGRRARCRGSTRVEPVQDGERIVTTRRVGDQQLLVATYHMPARCRIPTAVAVDAARQHHDRSSPPAACTRRWSKRKQGDAASAFCGASCSTIPASSRSSRRCRCRDSIDAAREAAIATLEGVAQRARHRGRGGSRPGEARSRPSTTCCRDPHAVRRPPVRSRSRPATGVSSSCSATAWRARDRRRRAARRAAFLKPANRTVGAVHSRCQARSRAAGAAPSTSSRWSRTTRAIPRSRRASSSTPRRPTSRRARSASRSPTA